MCSVLTQRPRPFASAEKADTKRQPAQPREGFTLENVTMSTVTPIPYDIVREGVKY